MIGFDESYGVTISSSFFARSAADILPKKIIQMRDYCDGGGVGEAEVRITKAIGVDSVKGFDELLF